MKTVSTAVTAVPASIAKNVDTAIDGITRAFVHKDLREVLTKIQHLLAVLRIRCLFDPWIWDPGWVKKNNLDHIFESLKKKQLFVLKYFISFMRIRDPGWKNSDPG